MTLDLLIPPRGLVPCPYCDETVRVVERTTGGIILINEHPDPEGTIIPWPAPDLVGVAQARVMDPVIPEDERWSEHACR